MDISTLVQDNLALLKSLIATQSFSKEEHDTALIIEQYLTKKGIEFTRFKNNVWAKNKHFDSAKPTILLNSHHDTVKPNKNYTLDPFSPIEKDGKIYGLGSNDAGGCLVSLINTFCYFHSQENLKYNLIIAATAEEEISGKEGIELLYPQLGKIDFAIIGEPTLMQPAIAEKGLMVMDCVAHGTSGHAAREEGNNAIYIAMKDINWISNYQFSEVSDFLGKVKMTVTIINAGSQHNVVPGTCEFTIDARLTEKYTHEEVLKVIRENISSEVTPRSTRIKPSFIDHNHPFVQAVIKDGGKTYGSPTTSDQALITCQSIKIGPGDSARSHSADEFIYIEELEEGLRKYIGYLGEVLG